VQWFRKTEPGAGNPMAELYLAEIYASSQGVPRDEAEAMRWYRKAAERGSAIAQRKLAAAYLIGDGVPRDDEEAAHWYMKASAQGDRTAQYALGALYVSGEGVPQDFAEAYFWLNLAATGTIEDPKHEEITRQLDSAAANLTEAALVQTQERVRKWSAEHSADGNR
jgi:uncharacterized protein